MEWKGELGRVRCAQGRGLKFGEWCPGRVPEPEREPGRETWNGKERNGNSGRSVAFTVLGGCFWEQCQEPEPGPETGIGNWREWNGMEGGTLAFRCAHGGRLWVDDWCRNPEPQPEPEPEPEREPETLDGMEGNGTR
jgi:hypothetical protein